MKFIYVLTSSENDTYYEQFLLSLESFRIFNPAAEIIALVDERTKNGLTGKRSEYEKLISEIMTIKVPVEFSQKEASRWIKTSIHHYIPGEFLFIDCDTIITDSLDYTFPREIKIGAVLDTHVNLDQHHLQKKFQKEDNNARFSSSLKTNTRYNGGVILCNDNPQAQKFYERWHSLWIEGLKRGCSQDMPSLNQAIYEHDGIITDLGGEWNCQISHNGLPYLSNSKIIHYYATSLNSLEPAFKLASEAVFQYIKENGKLSLEIRNLIENPKAAFEPFSRIISDKNTIDALDNSMLFKLIRFNKRSPDFSGKLNALKYFFFKK